MKDLEDTRRKRMNNKMQVLAGVLVGSVGFVTIMSIIPSFKGDRFPEDSVSKRETPTPTPKQQKVLRVWRGNPNDTISKSVCGIYTPPDEINNLQNQGWSIKTSQPFNYRLEQHNYAFNCLGSETVLEK